MSKKIKKNRYSLYNNPHSYSLGSSLKKFINSDSAGATGALAGGMVGGLIGNGLESNVGNIFNTVGDLASAIPGPWGAALGFGTKTLGGAYNALFGMKTDQEALNRANAGTDYLNSFTSDATYFDDVQGPQAQAAIGDVYKGGLFSSGKARRKNEALRQERALAQDFADRSVYNNVNNIADEQMNSMLANYAALGGPLHTHGADWSNGVTIIDSGGTHEENPFEGVPMGLAPDGQPNLVEEGEVIFNDYVFSNRLRVPKAIRSKYKLRGTKDSTFADIAKKIQKNSEERPNDPISKRSVETTLNELMADQEDIRQRRQARDTERMFAKGGGIHIAPSKRGTFTAAASKHGMGVQEFASKVLANKDDYSTAMVKKANFARNASKWKHAKGGPLLEMKYPDFNLEVPELKYTPVSLDKVQGITDVNTRYTPNRKGYNWLTGLRYVPALGAGIGVFSDLMGWTNKPDYSNADAIIDAANSVGNVSYTPIGDYMTYTPLDRLFYASRLGAQAGATRRNVMNTSGSNRGIAMAGLLGADYNAQGQLGNLYRQAEEYNLGQRERVGTFNRATNMFNAENYLKSQIANRENSRIKVDAAARAAAMRDAIDARVGAARSANLTNLFDSLGNIGREEVMKSWINDNPAFGYWISTGGRGVQYKGTNANGGFITIKKRRRK